MKEMKNDPEIDQSNKDKPKLGFAG